MITLVAVPASPRHCPAVVELQAAVQVRQGKYEMKFLIFNLVVAGALIYLVTGGDLSRLPSSGAATHRVTNTAKMIVDRGHDIAQKVIGQIDSKEDLPGRNKNGKAVTARVDPAAPTKLMPPVHGPKINQITTPKRTQEPNSSVRNQSLPVNDDGQKAIPEIARVTPNQPLISDPAVLQRRAEVLAESPAANAIDAPRFMSPRDRQRELQALSEAMELLSASTMAR